MNAPLSKENLVTHANCIAEARYTLSEREQKLILVLISLVQPKDKDFYGYEIPYQELAEILNLDKKSAIRELNKITNNLMSRVLEVPQENGDLLKTHWISDIIFKRGILKAFFSPNLKPYLLDLKCYFKSYKLNFAIQFGGKYTIRIYQLLKVNEYKGSVKYELSTFREILGIAKTKYIKFYEFKRWVLTKAKKQFETKYITDEETNDYYKSDVSFDLETRRTGRKISHLTFIIKQQQTEPTRKVKTITIQPKEKNTAIKNPHETSQTYQALNALGIQQKKAISLMEAYGENKIEEKLAILKATQNQKKIKNPAGFLMMALQQNYLSPEMLEKQKAEVRKQKEQYARQQKVRFEAAVEQISLKYLETHSNPQKNKVRDAFQTSAFYQKKFAPDSLLNYLYSEAETLEEALAISEFKDSLQAFIIWHYVPNAEHLRNLEAWQEWEEKSL